MKNLKIGIDLDGVIADSGKVMVQMVKDEFGLDIEKIQRKKKTKTMTMTYSLQDWPEVKKIKGCSEFIVEKFNEPEVYQQAGLIKDSLLAVRKWQRQGHRLWIITARPPEMEAVTLEWLKGNGFNHLVKNRRIVFHDSLGRVNSDFKPGVIKKLKIQIFIEDNAMTLMQTESEFLIKKLLIKRLYNFDQDVDEKTQLVKDWQEIEKVVEEVALS